MTRFADPARCPNCSTAMTGADGCTSCGVSFTSVEARELWAVLNRADALLSQMRHAAAVPAAGPATTTPRAPRLPRRPKRSLSTGSIILALGALCLVVAAFIFITVSWGSIGLLGRTLVLLGVTVVVGAIAAMVTVRTLRGSAEALWAILAGFVTLDYFAAREYGLLGLDDLRFSDALLLFGLIFMAMGVAVSVWAKRVAGVRLVVTQIIAVFGSYAACAGVDIPGWRGAYVALAALALGLILVAGMFRAGLPHAAAAAAAGPGIAYLVALGNAADDVATSQDVASLWGDGRAWSMIAVVAVTIGLGVCAQRWLTAGAPTAAGWCASVAGAITTWGVASIVYAPVSDLTDDVQSQLVIMAFALVVVAACAPLVGHWGRGIRLASLTIGIPLAVTALDWVVDKAIGTVVESAVNGQWVASWDYRLRVDDITEPSWLGSCVIFALAVSLFLLSRWKFDPKTDAIDKVQTRLRAAAVITAMLAALVQLALNPLPVIALSMAVVVASAALLLLAARAGHVVGQFGGIGLTLIACGIPLVSDVASLATWVVAAAVLAWASWRASRTDLQVLGAGGAAALLLGSTVAAVHVGQFADRWQMLALLAAAGILALAAQMLTTARMRRDVIEYASAAGAVGALFWATDSTLAWQSLLWTVTGAVLVVIALWSKDRRILAVAGSGALAIAYVLRLAASDVDVVEAYTLPIGVALLIVGLIAMVKVPTMTSRTALSAGLMLSLLPSLPVVLFDNPAGVRGLFLGLGSIAALVLGVARKWQSPFVIGAALTGILAVRHLGPFANAPPRWMLIGAAGLLLLLAGITWESRVKNAKSAIAYLGDLR